MTDQRPRPPTPPEGEAPPDGPSGESPYPLSDEERRALSPRDPLRKERAADGGTRSRGEARQGAGARKKKRERR